MAGILSPETAYFTAGPGDTIIIERPFGFAQNPPGASTNSNSAAADAKYYQNGFTVKYHDIGEFSEESNVPNNSRVVYKHNKNGKQVITYAANGCIQPQELEIVIQPISVHDHASVYQGGPAFATYYAKKPQEE